MGNNNTKDVPDPSSGLTPRQKDAIRESWKLMDKHQKMIGTKFFVKFFSENPTYTQTFTRFRHVTLDDLPNNKALQAHAVTFMKGMGTLVENVDDLECMDELLYKIATRHHPFGLKASDLHKGTDMFAETLMDLENNMFETLEYPPEFVVASWKKAFDVIIPIVGEYIDDLQRAEDECL
ncbi:unnamed protein product [Notodromas monacha]|uniref:Globin domain-containing protein n=1 Tax=Notodromas monacha TaxID=399045 RepID=A0A7R9BPL5_9CRUS|nr:unnamed protein product [Notodromas monacha]CAD7283490.1 unnamed protein product [Notodromas monacha]CAG0917973.1 unnamed protein product [Notodromas monacha]CAG0923642.1 unnamed protein product [Notodromas monacha]